MNISLLDKYKNPVISGFNMEDALVKRLKKMTAGEIAEKDVCISTGSLFIGGLQSTDTLESALEDLEIKKGFAVYRSYASPKGFAILAVVVDEKYLAPGNLTKEIAETFFKGDSETEDIARYNAGIDVVFKK